MRGAKAEMTEGGADATRECCVGAAHQRVWQVITLATAVIQELNTEHRNC